MFVLVVTLVTWYPQVISFGVTLTEVHTPVLPLPSSAGLNKLLNLLKSLFPHL